ncbi:O-antigen ligase family protein [Nocardioides sp. YIM 152588]|uniref:O-antigen ligase family protein n=1 Tax=Nocardioides sp. YIM 152588 TaxID=3158259 RepID=UPI0032E499DF
MRLRNPARPPATRAGVIAGGRTADMATILAIFVALQFLLPSKLVLGMLPVSLSPASLLALSIGLLWLCAQMTTTLGAAKGRNPVRTMLFCYAIALVASYGSASFGYLAADERDNSDHAIVIVFSLIFVALAACDGIRTRERVYFLLRVMVVCAALVGIVGILQFLVGFDLTAHMQLPGTYFSNDYSAVSSRAGLRRVGATTTHPIEYAVFSAMMLPLAVHLAFRSASAGRSPRFWWACVGVIGTGVLFAVSRSGIVAFASAAIVLVIGWPAHRRKLMIGVGVALLVAMKLVAPGLLGTFVGLFRNAGNDTSISWRTHDYATARELIAQHPWLGRGIGTWYAPKHEVFDNQYLGALVETGILGLVTFLGILVAAVYAAWRVRSLARTHAASLPTAEWDRDLALALVAAIVPVFPAYATFDFAAFLTATSLAYLLVGISGAHLRIVRDEVEGVPIDPYAVR